MLTTRTAAWPGLVAVVVTLGAMAGLVTAAGGQVLAQSGQECWEMRRVMTGEDANGNPTFGWRLVNVCESGGGEGGSGGGGAGACQHAEFGEFPCYDQARGWWTSTRGGCYARLLSPQPAAGDARWGSGGPEDGSLYILSCPRDVLGSLDFAESYVVFDQPPELPSVTQLAQQAMESLPLAPADIGIAPGPDGAGLVGLPVWMWTNDTEATWGPVTVSVPGPGITVTAQGTATQIEWNMGDGTTVVCEGPGTPYEPRFGDQHSPDCGHVYTAPSRSQPGGRYAVTAITTWHLEWWVEPRGSGAEGEDFDDRTSETTVRINELQVVTS